MLVWTECHMSSFSNHDQGKVFMPNNCKGNIFWESFLENMREMSYSMREGFWKGK